jgi:hemerythrin-like domain-containing protein
MAEHELISKVLDSFDRWSEALLLEPKEDRLSLKRFLSFFADFTDGAHHVKEERVLFAALLRHGFSDKEGPVAVMNWEHEEARTLMRDLGLLASGTGEWTKEICEDINTAATTYVTLLRNHIDKENDVLYPMAEKRLPPKEWDEIATAFANIDEELECAGMWEENLALADVLLKF